MISLTPQEIAGMVGGTLTDEGNYPRDAEEALPDSAPEQVTVIGPVVVDSREISRGSLFVALPGERVDGHAYAEQAVRHGAALAITTRPVGVPAVVVDDAQVALGRLARGVLDRLSVPVVGVTGSSGKTSTKDLMAQVLCELGPVVAPPGSFNNEIGLPLTVLRADATTRALVLEMGARGVGHIRTLTEIAPPRVGVVLNVGSAHVGEFGGKDMIARAKGELVEALPDAERGGVAVLNADDPLVLAMAERTSARVLTFGVSPDADVRAENIEMDDMGRASFTLCAGDTQAPVTLRLHGTHHVSNALAAAAAGRALGLNVPEIARALSNATALSRWRMEVTRRSDDVVIINDCYNANPESMKAALKALASMGRGRRRWAVLGEMRELGDDSAREHDEIGRLAVRLDVSRLLVIGEGAKAMHLGASLEGSWDGESQFVPDAETAIEVLRSEVRGGDTVLIKASRGVALERVASALCREPASCEPMPATGPIGEQEGATRAHDADADVASPPPDSGAAT